LGFWYWYDLCKFLDLRYVVLVDHKVIDFCEVFYCKWAEVFELLDVDFVRSSRVVVFAVFDGFLVCPGVIM